MAGVNTGVLEHGMAEQRRFYVSEGLLLVGLGILAILLPMATALTINMIVAVVFLVAGIGRLITWSRQTIDRQWKLLGGVLFLLAGLWMVLNPWQGTGALVISLGILLILEGILEMAMAYAYWPLSRSGWLLLSGGVSLLLGVLLLTTLGAANSWLLALIAGINLMLAGLSVSMLAWSAGR